MVPIVARYRLIVALQRREPGTDALMLLADLSGVAGHLNSGIPQEAIAPAQRRVSRRIIFHANRLVAHARIDVVGPERARLEEMLIRVDDAHAVCAFLPRPYCGRAVVVKC